jgi:hypothetical protein
MCVILYFALSFSLPQQRSGAKAPAKPQHRRWEYKVVDRGWQEWTDPFASSEAVKGMNRLGSDGWELAAIVRDVPAHVNLAPPAVARLFYYKRPEDRSLRRSWEYQALELGSYDKTMPFDRISDNVKQVALRLKKLGEDGWELVAAVRAGQGMDWPTYYVFRRAE